MEAVQAIALALGSGWASGINLYAAVCMLGVLGMTDTIQLPPELQVVATPAVVGIAGLMYVIEFFADKTPGVDTAWDSIHTFIRIPAGAVLAAGAIGPVAPGAELAAFLAGGTMAAGSHAVKAGSRAVINTSPEPFSNWIVSFTEDILVLAGLWTALNHPWVFLVLLALFVLFAIWFIPKVWRLLKQIFGKVGDFFRKRRAPSEEVTPQ